MIQIPLSQITSTEAFRADVDRHIAALKKHQMGKPGIVAPRAHELVESVIERQPQDGPVNKRGPDDFVVASYEILDDTPQAPPEPTLAEMKVRLGFELQQAGAAAKANILSPARAQLLGMDAAEAMAVPEASRTLAQRAALDAYTTYMSQCAAIDREMLRAAVVIEELTEATIGSWRVPSL